GPILYNVQEKTTKYLICLGGQYQRGHAVLEWSFPFGINRVRTTGTDPIKYSESQNQNLYLAPGIALGFRW
ncbi:MAG: hypothetical protein ABIO24_03905, partial [Saprospiraceae bacterium]